MRNKIYYGDNLKWMQNVDEFPSKYVDLIYLDPPFNSKRAYNIIYKDKDGGKQAQTKAFDDTWTWKDVNKFSTYEKLIGTKGYKDTIIHQSVLKYAPEIPIVIESFYKFLGRNNMMSYLIMMTPRLIEMKRILKDTGSIYLHCDPTASHYLKIIMDSIFGIKNYQNEIIWFYPDSPGRPKSAFPRKHDIIFRYVKSDKYTFNDKEIRVPILEASKKRYNSPRILGGHSYIGGKSVEIGKIPEDVWRMPVLKQNSAEAIGYQTQKPLALLERIIKTSSNKGDIVFDPFCGCATTLIASGKLNRKWIGIDMTYLSVNLLEQRIKKEKLGFKRGEDYIVNGTPESLYAAKQLKKNRGGHEFGNWAITKLGGIPNPKKTGDAGIDGFYPFYDNNIKKECLIQVKSGHLTLSAVRDFCHVIVREKADMGIFLVMEKPSTNMISEFASMGTYVDSLGYMYPKVQFIRISDLINNKKPNIPKSSNKTII